MDQQVMALSPAAGWPGDVAGNAAAIRSALQQARAAGCQLLVLPELCLAGCTAGELLAHPLVIKACWEEARSLAREAASMALALGLPVMIEGQVYNAAAVIWEGAVQGLVLKRHLSWRERQLFSPGDQVALSGWPCPVHVGDQGYFTLPNGRRLQVCFLDDMKKAGSAELLALMGALPARAGGGQALRHRLSACLGEAVGAWANAGLAESSTDQVYDGQCLMLARGLVLRSSAHFGGEAYPFAPDPRMPYAPLPGAARAAWCREALEIAAQGLALRMKRIGARGITLGLSGGLDSAMALLTALRVFEINGLDREQLLAVSLPAFGTSHKTRGNAERLQRACGLAPREIDITESVRRHFQDIGHPEDLHNAVFENAQARERTQVLMDLANQTGGLMIGPGDMSELALGFTTYGGDHMSMYGVNAGLPKTAIRLIVAQAAQDTDNKALQAVLRDILDTPISPELIPGEGGSIRQRTEDILGPYILNDFFLYHLLTQRLAPGELLEKALAAFDGESDRQEILRHMRGFFTRFIASQFKRSCLADGPQVLDLSLSPRGGLTLPSDASSALFTTAIDQLIKGESSCET